MYRNISNNCCSLSFHCIKKIEHQTPCYCRHFEEQSDTGWGPATGSALFVLVFRSCSFFVYIVYNQQSHAVTLTSGTISYWLDCLQSSPIMVRGKPLILAMWSLLYEERLSRTGLWTLWERLIRADLIEVYKIIHLVSSVSFLPFFNFLIILSLEDIH